jgi:hypothetical protein
MNLQELKNIIELARDYSDTMIFIYKIYLPVSDAIADNNKTVISYLLNCEASDRLNLLEAIEDGAKRLNILRSYKLLGVIKKDKKNLANRKGLTNYILSGII